MAQNIYDLLARQDWPGVRQRLSNSLSLRTDLTGVEHQVAASVVVRALSELAPLEDEGESVGRELRRQLQAELQDSNRRQRWRLATLRALEATLLAVPEILELEFPVVLVRGLFELVKREGAEAALGSVLSDPVIALQLLAKARYRTRILEVLDLDTAAEGAKLVDIRRRVSYPQLIHTVCRLASSADNCAQEARIAIGRSTDVTVLAALVDAITSPDADGKNAASSLLLYDNLLDSIGDSKCPEEQLSRIEMLRAHQDLRLEMVAHAVLVHRSADSNRQRSGLDRALSLLLTPADQLDTEIRRRCPCPATAMAPIKLMAPTLALQFTRRAAWSVLHRSPRTDGRVTPLLLQTLATGDPEDFKGALEASICRAVRMSDVVDALERRVPTTHDVGGDYDRQVLVAGIDHYSKSIRIDESSSEGERLAALRRRHCTSA